MFSVSRTELSRLLWCKQNVRCQCVLVSGLKWPFLASIKNTGPVVISSADTGDALSAV